MFCINCGNQPPQDAKFCNKCGALVINDEGSQTKEDFQPQQSGGVQPQTHSVPVPPPVLQQEDLYRQATPEWQPDPRSAPEAAATHMSKHERVTAALRIKPDSKLPLAAGLIMLAVILIRAFYMIFYVGYGHRNYDYYIFIERLPFSFNPHIFAILSLLECLLFAILSFFIIKKSLKPLIIPLALTFCIQVAQILAEIISPMMPGFTIWYSYAIFAAVHLVILVMYSLTAGGVIKTKIPFLVATIVMLSFRMYAAFETLAIMIREFVHIPNRGWLILFNILIPNIGGILPFIAYLLIALAMSKIPNLRNTIGE